jgi:hypothetical protein
VTVARSAKWTSVLFARFRQPVRTAACTSSGRAWVAMSGVSSLHAGSRHPHGGVTVAETDLQDAEPVRVKRRLTDGAPAQRLRGDRRRGPLSLRRPPAQGEDENPDAPVGGTMAGLQVTNGPESCNSLTRERTMAGDGKVTREPGSRYRVLQPEEEKRLVDVTTTTHVWDRHTGELVCGKDMEGDTHLYMTASGPAVGYKTVRMVVRSDDTNSSITLAVRRPATKDEAICAVQAAHDVRKRLPGMLALTYDAALRGTHIRALGRDSRLVTIARSPPRRTSKASALRKAARSRTTPTPARTQPSACTPSTTSRASSASSTSTPRATAP